MKLVYNDANFTAIVEFLSWLSSENKMIWFEEGEQYDGTRTFLLDVSDPYVSKNDNSKLVLLDAAIYPEWKDIQRKFPNDDLYHQLIQFVNFYYSEFEFDMSLLLKLLNNPENKKKFEKILEKYSIN
ncbi:hypothetical protein RyT2_29380 [Pseudolactococcus yaeyamensis]